MTDTSCDPSPNTGASPVRASLNTLRTSRSPSPYTVGGRTMVQERAIVRPGNSAAGGTGFIDGLRRPRWPRRGERGDEHEPLRRALCGGLEHVGRPVAVGVHELVQIAGADASRQVIDHFGPRAPRAERSGVVQVAPDQTH